METRQIRGKEIADKLGKYIKKTSDGWLVPSQTTDDMYKVDENFVCSCPDCQKRNVTCKHAFAVRFYLKTELRTPQGTIIKEKRLSTPQAWAVYDKSQTQEKQRFMELLNDLCHAIPQPAQTIGRKRTDYHDLLFAAALKVYSQFSLRRFESDLRVAREKGFVEKAACFASVGHFIQQEDVTPILHALIALSASPLKVVETDFAVDSTGFRTTRFNEYCNEKHELNREHSWVKAHVITGVKTNIVTSAVITEANAADCPQFAPLVQATANNGFTIVEASADKAYGSADNYNAIQQVGGALYVPFKEGQTGTTHGAKYRLWRKMFHYFQLNQEEFYAHYHKRSNVETTFSMIKAKFNDVLKSKTTTAQTNECLLKILCHNIVVVAQEVNELGITADFCVKTPASV